VVFDLKKGDAFLSQNRIAKLIEKAMHSELLRLRGPDETSQDRVSD